MPTDALVVSVVAAVLVGMVFVFVIKPLVIPPRDERLKDHEAVGFAVEPGMNDPKFWELIDHAWDNLDVAQARLDALDPARKDEAVAALVEKIELMAANLEASLEKLNEADLVTFDALMERKLYDLDRPDVHAHLEGSDDGFMYGRGFVVAVGRDYYRAVNANPSLGSTEGEAETLCYIGANVYEERTGNWLEHKKGIYRESGSNPLWNGRNVT